MGARAIAPMGHVRMMAAVQPFLSGAISKTVNLPETATVEEIEDIYLAGLEARPQGARGLPRQLQGRPAAVRRQGQEAPTATTGRGRRAEVEKVVEYRPVRKRLPKQRPVADDVVHRRRRRGLHDRRRPTRTTALGEVFLKLGKQGSTLAGVMDAFSIAVSIGLQYGVPLETYVAKFTNLRFEPAGLTDDPDVRMAQSIMDYIFRRLALDYLPFETRVRAGHLHRRGAGRASSRPGSLRGRRRARSRTTSSRLAQSAPVDRRRRRSAADGPVEPRRPRSRRRPRRTPPPSCWRPITGTAADAPLCFTCGTKMRPAGSCYVCEGCGSTSGCS